MVNIDGIGTPYIAAPTIFHDPATGRPHGDDPQDPKGAVSKKPAAGDKNMENPMENHGLNIDDRWG